MDNLHQALAYAIKLTRKHTGLTQEDFSTVSSRTYLSTLERGLKSPTVEKLEDIAKVMNTHPLTLLAIAYAQLERTDPAVLLQKIIVESELILESHNAK